MPFFVANEPSFINKMGRNEVTRQPVKPDNVILVDTPDWKCEDLATDNPIFGGGSNNEVHRLAIDPRW